MNKKIKQSEKKYLNMTLEEITQLEGVIHIIDLQNGCPHRCIACGENAPKYTENMPFENVLKISQKIKKIKQETNIDILSEEIIPFSKSDPITYFSKGNTIYDVVKLFLTNHPNKNIVFTTAGWNPENHYQENAIKNMLSDEEIRKKIQFMYSVKTITHDVIQEYIEFKKKNSILDTSELCALFAQQSKYVSKTSSNMKTLCSTNQWFGDLSRNAYNTWNLQYIQMQQLLDKNFSNTKYSEIKELFSYYMINQIYRHIKLDSGIKKTKLPKHTTRALSGYGRGKDIGLKLSKTRITYLESMKNILNSVDIRHLPGEYYAKILYDGTLEFRIGNPHGLDNVILSRELLQKLIKNNNYIIYHIKSSANMTFHREKCEESIKYRQSTIDKYTILANLQGRNLLE